ARRARRQPVVHARSPRPLCPRSRRDRPRAAGPARVTSDTLVSVVLPAYKQVDHIADVVREFSAALGRMPLRHELVLVPNGPSDGTNAVCAELAATMPDVRSEPIEKGGWGRAVKHGIAQARGDLICYTNSARTSPAELTLTILYAATHPGIVV